MSLASQQVFCDSFVGKVCTPCHGKLTHELSEKQESDFGKSVPCWKNNNRRSLSRAFPFKTLKALFLFIDAIAHLAEKEGHHPDFAYKNGIFTCSLYTHALRALSENDFVLAKKIDELWRALNSKNDDCKEEKDDDDDNGDRAIRRDKASKTHELTAAWKVQPSLSGRFFVKYNLASFIDAVTKFKAIISLIDNGSKCDYDLYLFYDQIRVDLKKSFDAKGVLTKKARECALAIEALF